MGMVFKSWSNLLKDDSSIDYLLLLLMMLLTAFAAIPNCHGSRLVRGHCRSNLAIVVGGNSLIL